MSDTYTLADLGALMSRIRTAVPEPLLDGFRATVACRLADRTLAGGGVARAVILALADRMTATGLTHVTDAVWGQTLRVLEACVSDAPESIRREALDQFALVAMASGVC